MIQSNPTNKNFGIKREVSAIASGISAKRNLLLKFNIFTSFGSNLVIARADIKLSEKALFNQFVQMPPESFHAKCDVVHFHVFINRLWREGQAVRGKEPQYLAFSGRLCHCFRHELYAIYPHRLGPNSNISVPFSTSAVNWEDKWTTFIVYRLLCHANDSLGANGPVSNMVNSARGGAECGRDDPTMQAKPHDRGRTNVRHPQKDTGTTYEQRGQTEVASA